MNIAVIPARGGSKRINRKNIKNFCGKPIIYWPIEIAIRSEFFDKVIISTDDEEIAKVSEQFGAEVLFMRPENLSDDYTDIGGVLSHAVSWLNQNNLRSKYICCIYPTSVFFSIQDLKKGYQALSSNSNWQYSFSVTDFDYPIFRSFEKNPSGELKMFFPEYYHTRSQDLPLALHDASQFYWGKSNAWLKKLKIFESHSFPIKIPRWRVQDIDTEDDWKRAEFIFNSLKNNGK